MILIFKNLWNMKYLPFSPTLLLASLIFLREPSIPRGKIPQGNRWEIQREIFARMRDERTNRRVSHDLLAIISHIASVASFCVVRASDRKVHNKW